MANIIVTPGAHTATVPITVVPTSLAGSLTVILTTDSAGANIAYTSATVAFTSTAALQNVSVPVTVPAAGGTWYVWVGVTLSGINLGMFAQGNTLTGQSIAIGTIIWS